MKRLQTKPRETTTSNPTNTGGLSPARNGDRNEGSAEERRASIAESANMKTKRRGLQGYVEQDWLEAEAEFDERSELRARSDSTGELPQQLDW